MKKVFLNSMLAVCGLLVILVAAYLIYRNKYSASVIVQSTEICDNGIDDNNDGKTDGCWDPGSNYQPTGQIYWVATNGNDSNDGSEARPFKTFAKAASLVRYHPETNKSDALYVKSGTYSETINMQNSGKSTRPIVVRGVGATKPIIKVGGGNVAHIEPKSNTIIDNFETHGIDTYTSAGHGLGGYGVFLSDVENVMIDHTIMQEHEKGVRAEYGNRLIVRNSLIKNCEWGTYIGTDNDNGFSPEFNNTLWENVEAADTAYRDYGNTDGFLIEGYSAYHVFRNCKSHGWTDAGFDLKPHVLVENSIAYNNSWTNGKDDNGHGFKIWRDGIVRNSIAYNNRLANYLYGGYQPNWKMVNNISYNGRAIFEKRSASSPLLTSTSIKLSHNIFYKSPIVDEIGGVLAKADHNIYFDSEISAAPENTSKVVDPRLNNPTQLIFTLQSGSPAINSGLSSIANFMSQTDIAGNNRKSGPAVDIGPYEFNSTTGPNCSDGVKNGDETGIDCGGSCPACSITPNCHDGVQNGNETGIDCGGNCPTCSQPNDSAYPKLTSYSTYSVVAGRRIGFAATAAGQDSTQVLISATSLPDGARFSDNRFIWDVPSTKSGTHSVKLRGRDGRGNAAEWEIIIKVIKRVSFIENRLINYENKPGEAISFQVCRNSLYTNRYIEVFAFGDGSDYKRISEPGRSGCSNFYTHNYQSPGEYQLSLYLCTLNPSGNLTGCFPNAVKRIIKP